MEKIYYVPTDKKIMSLTFDDGPNEPVRPIILQILKKYNAKATFFVLLEQALKYPNIIRKIIDEGHAIGIHGTGHVSYSKYSPEQIYKDVLRSIEVFSHVFKTIPKYLRPPYGTFPISVQTVCKKFGLVPVGWTIMIRDWKPRNPEQKIGEIVARLSSGKILILHDVSWQQSLSTLILNTILPVLSENYSFVSLKDLLAARNVRKIEQGKIFNGVTLLGSEAIEYMKYIGYTDLSLFLYWDVNSIGSQNKTFDIKIVSNNKTLKKTLNFPNPEAMSEWPCLIKLPRHFLTKNSQVFIKDAQGNFVKI